MGFDPAQGAPKWRPNKYHPKMGVAHIQMIFHYIQIISKYSELANCVEEFDSRLDLRNMVVCNYVWRVRTYQLPAYFT